MDTTSVNHCIDASKYEHYSLWLELLNIDFWPRWIAVIVVMMPFMLMLIDFVLVQYIVVRHWDEMAKALKSSQDFRWPISPRVARAALNDWPDCCGIDVA